MCSSDLKRLERDELVISSLETEVIQFLKELDLKIEQLKEKCDGV